jgi:inosine-uridine nucleoside N-ribohydrolase
MRLPLLLLSVLLVISGCGNKTTYVRYEPDRIIFDTDFGPDYDDVGALAVLHALADSGKIEILGTISSNKNILAAPSIEVINTYFGRADIRIGAPKSKGVDIGAAQHWTDTILSKYPHIFKTTNQVPDAVEIYRQVLCQQPDSSVTIVSVGFLTNLNNLLLSKPDIASPLTGYDLVRKKVKKLVAMAGQFPEGKEFNVFSDIESSKNVFDKWPGTIIFTGYEVGKNIKTGLKLANSDQTYSPVKDVFKLCIPLSPEDLEGRMSWDETAVIIAIYGTDRFFDTVRGKIHINNDGSNTWENNSNGNHYYVKLRISEARLSEFIEARMMHLPL